MLFVFLRGLTFTVKVLPLTVIGTHSLWLRDAFFFGGAADCLFLRFHGVEIEISNQKQ